MRRLTEKIIRAFYKVYNVLGYGFLEKVCENAMMIELQKQGVAVVAQKNTVVYYDDKEIGNYFADLLAERCVIVELKAMKTICEEHEAQLLNYLRATRIEVGILLNFGKKPEFKRKIFQNHLKGKERRIRMKRIFP